MDRNIVITPKTIVFTALAVVVAFLLIQIKEILALLFVALMIALVISPFVDFLVTKKIKRSVAVLLTLLLVVVVLGGLIAVSLTPIINQTELFINQFPKLLETVFKSISVSTALQNFGNTLTQQLGNVSGGLIKFTIDVLSGAVSILSVVVFSAYILVDFDHLKKIFIGLLPRPSYQHVATETIREIEQRLGGWLRGQLIGMGFVGLTTFVGLMLLRVEFAVPLAVFAFLGELVPFIGSTVSFILAVIVGFSISPIMGIAVGGLYLLVQQVQWNLVIPRIMKKAVGLNPLVTLLALLIGGRLFGVVGAFLSLPVTLSLYIVVKNIIEHSSSKAE